MEQVIEGEVELDSGIVPIGKLGVFEDFTANGFFDEVTDAESAKQQVNNMERLKKLMEAAEQYGQYASQFCEQEFRLFLKIAEIEGAENKLPAAKRRMVEWLRAKSDGEKSEILEQCKDGQRLHVIFNRETRQKVSYDPLKDCERISRDIVKEAMSTGRTTLTKATFYQRAAHPEKLDDSAIRAYMESTRDQLLKKKVLGLGDGNGTYVSPEKCDRQEVAAIVKTRLESIVADLKTIKQICGQTGFIVPKSGVKIICELIESLNDNTDVLNLSI